MILQVWTTAKDDVLKGCELHLGFPGFATQGEHLKQDFGGNSHSDILAKALRFLMIFCMEDCC